MARTPAPVARLAAYCFLCTRTMIDAATGEPITVDALAKREGACTECLAEIRVCLAPDAPTGTPAVTDRPAPAPAALVPHDGWTVTGPSGRVEGWARTESLATALAAVVDNRSRAATSAA